MSAPITSDSLLLASEKVFINRESTMEQEAAAFSVDVLKHSALAHRQALRDAASNLPELAFAVQPDDLDGNDVWSAGEILSHVAGAMIWTERNLRQILGIDDLPTQEEIKAVAHVRVRSKPDALAALSVADEKLRAILDLIPPDVNTSRTIDHDDFGTIGIKGWLLLTAIHEDDHVRQLRELGAGLAIR